MFIEHEDSPNLSLCRSETFGEVTQLRRPKEVSIISLLKELRVNRERRSKNISLLTERSPYRDSLKPFSPTVRNSFFAQSRYSQPSPRKR